MLNIWYIVYRQTCVPTEVNANTVYALKAALKIIGKHKARADNYMLSLEIDLHIFYKPVHTPR